MSIKKVIKDKIESDENHKLNVMTYNLVEQDFKNAKLTFYRKNPSSEFYNTDEMGVGPFYKNVSQLISSKNYDDIQSD
ncbi:MAG: hypothetical protein WBA74_19580 [Cyclobacteriaceae bacterium]